MRIDELSLIAYGPFTNQTLDFSKGKQGLHVVVGANEAGKSSALRALEAALFKIPGQTNDNFLHSNTDLRLGLSLRAPDGRILSFLRKKKNKDALWNSDGTEVLDEQKLRAFLTNLSEADFKRAYALDHKSLHEGAARLVQPQEGVDGAIVGAALGLRDLKAVGDRLRQEAEALFSPRGSTKMIHKVLAELKTLEASMKEKSLPERLWSEVRKERDDAERDFRSLREREALTSAEVEILKFCVHRRNRIVAVEAERLKLEEIGANFDLPLDFAVRKQDSERRELESRVALDGEKARIDKKREELEQVPEDSPILAVADEIQALRDRVRAFVEASDELRRRQTKDQADTEEVEALARKIGLKFPLSGDDRARVKLVKEQRAHWSSLRDEHHRIAAKKAAALAGIQVLKLKVEQAEKAQEKTEVIADLRGLERAIKEATIHLNLEETIAAKIKSLKSTSQRMEAARAAIPGLDCALDELTSLALPSRSTVESALKKIAEIEEEQRRSREDRARVLGDLGRVEDEKANLVARTEIPSLDALQRHRERRDAQWGLVRRAWIGHEEVEEEAQALDSDRPLSEAFPRSMAEADDMSDQLRRESDRVARFEELGRRQEQLGRELKELASRDVEIKKRWDATHEAWRSLWSSLSSISDFPAAMLDTLKRIEDLQSWGREQTQLSLDLAAESEQRDEVLGQLRSAAASLVQDAALPSDVATLSGALDHAEQLKSDFQARAEASRRLVDEMRRQEEALKEAELALLALKDESLEWNRSLEATKKRMGLAKEDSVEDSLESLEDWRLLASQFEYYEESRARREAIQTEAEELESASLKLSENYLQGGDELSLEERSSKLSAELESAKRAAEERLRAKVELQKIEASCVEYEQNLRLARSQLNELLKEARVDDIGLLPALISLSELKRELPQGWSFEDALKKLESLKDADLQKEISTLESQLALLGEQIFQKRDAATLARRQLDDFDKELGVHEISQEIASKKSLIREESQRYLKLVLTSQLLSQTQRRFRNQHERPILQHASRYLNTLTEGRYSAVDVDLDDKDQSFFLIREARNSKSKVMDQLSDGTRDQLHLALVLGALEHRFDSGTEAMPLILDDVLVHFDDARSEAALRALADFSAKTQVLLFSHHERIADQARALDRPDEIFVQELCRQDRSLEESR